MPRQLRRPSTASAAIYTDAASGNRRFRFATRARAQTFGDVCLWVGRWVCRVGGRTDGPDGRTETRSVGRPGERGIRVYSHAAGRVKPRCRTWFDVLAYRTDECRLRLNASFSSVGTGAVPRYRVRSGVVRLQMKPPPGSAAAAVVIRDRHASRRLGSPRRPPPLPQHIVSLHHSTFRSPA